MTKEDYMRLPKVRLAELLAERDEQDRNKTIIPYQPALGGQYNPPCFAPDGICVNPQRDCINCPKTHYYNPQVGGYTTTTNGTE